MGRGSLARLGCALCLVLSAAAGAAPPPPLGHVMPLPPSRNYAQFASAPNAHIVHSQALKADDAAAALKLFALVPRLLPAEGKEALSAAWNNVGVAELRANRSRDGRSPERAAAALATALRLLPTNRLARLNLQLAEDAVKLREARRAAGGAAAEALFGGLWRRADDGERWCRDDEQALSKVIRCSAAAGPQCWLLCILLHTADLCVCFGCISSAAAASPLAAQRATQGPASTAAAAAVATAAPAAGAGVETLFTLPFATPAARPAGAAAPSCRGGCRLTGGAALWAASQRPRSSRHTIRAWTGCRPPGATAGHRSSYSRPKGAILRCGSRAN